MSTQSQSKPACAIASAVWPLGTESQAPTLCPPLRQARSTVFGRMDVVPFVCGGCVRYEASAERGARLDLVPVRDRGELVGPAALHERHDGLADALLDQGVGALRVEGGVRGQRHVRHADQG